MKKCVKNLSFQKNWKKGSFLKGRVKKIQKLGKNNIFKGNMKKCAIFRKNGSKNEVYGEKKG